MADLSRDAMLGKPAHSSAHKTTPDSATARLRGPLQLDRHRQRKARRDIFKWIGRHGRSAHQNPAQRQVTVAMGHGDIKISKLND